MLQLLLHLKDHLAAIAGTHDVRLLPLYDTDDTLVPENQIEKKLRGALVEVTYRLLHYNMTKEGKLIESFTGEIQQIVIKKHGKEEPRTRFTRAARPLTFGPVSSCAPTKTVGTSKSASGAASGVANTNIDLHEKGDTVPDTNLNGKRTGDTLQNPITKKS
ncbi:hypothetical protein R3P38DRAFT_3215534 [Favolaschia claudopus]|uniref:Uncharacterized protein n=1 Tax=Favolaschia claudopus TaxID=2862362 RepID=A0AAW0A926_9AGAR